MTVFDSNGAEVELTVGNVAECEFNGNKMEVIFMIVNQYIQCTLHNKGILGKEVFNI